MYDDPKSRNIPREQSARARRGGPGDPSGTTAGEPA